MEDALKKLDNLTKEEARMIIAENLRATHAVDERVRGVAAQVHAVGDRVANVDERVANVGERVANIDDRVANVNDKVTEVIHGVQIIFRRLRLCLILNCSDGRETNQVVKQVERSSSPNLIDIDYEALTHHFRKPITREHPQMALPAGSLN